MLLFNRRLLVVSMLLAPLFALPATAQGPHSADTLAPANAIDLFELLRVIQLFNSDEYHCDAATEDGYAPGPGPRSCPEHDGDFAEPDWQITLSELLRVVQFFNVGGYRTGCESEDGFSPVGSGLPCAGEGEGEGAGVEGAAEGGPEGAAEGSVEGEATEGETPEGESTEGEQSEGQPAEGETPEGEPTEGAPEGGETPEGEPAEGETPEGAPEEGETPEGEPAEGETPEGEPTEGEPTEGDPGEGAPEEGEGAEGETQEGEPVEGAPAEGEVPEGSPAEGEIPEGAPIEGADDEGEGDVIIVEGMPMEGAPPEGEPMEGAPVEGDPAEGEGEGGPIEGEGTPLEGEPAEGEGIPAEGEPAEGEGDVMEGEPVEGEPEPPAPFPVAVRELEFTDPDRGNRTIPVRVFYPGETATENAPVASSPQPFPVVVVGHGFTIGIGAYEYLGQALTPEGYIVALVDTETGFLPDHAEFGADLSLTADSLRAANTDSSSPFFGVVAETAAIMGHSMGGGATFLGTAANPTITTLVGLAPAETNPSAIDAAANIAAPGLIFAGANDRVTPLDGNQQPMYDNLAGDCRYLVNITDGGHCNFAGSSFTCSIGEGAVCAFCSFIDREAQQDIVVDLVVPWYALHLQGRADAVYTFGDRIDAGIADGTFVVQRDCP